MLDGFHWLRILVLYLSHIPFVGFLDPFNGLLLDSLLGFPFGCFSFGSGRDLLYVVHFSDDHVC